MSELLAFSNEHSLLEGGVCLGTRRPCMKVSQDGSLDSVLDIACFATKELAPLKTVTRPSNC